MMLSHPTPGLAVKLVSFTNLSGYTLHWEWQAFFLRWVARREHQRSQSSEVPFIQKQLHLSSSAPLRT